MIGLVIASFVSTIIPVVCCIFNEDLYHVSIIILVYICFGGVLGSINSTLAGKVLFSVDYVTQVYRRLNAEIAWFQASRRKGSLT